MTQSKLYDFSIVTFPAYAGATTGLRGYLPKWWLPTVTPTGNLRLPELTRSTGRESWRLGPKSWELPTRKKPPSWRL